MTTSLVRPAAAGTSTVVGDTIEPVLLPDSTGTPVVVPGDRPVVVVFHGGVADGGAVLAAYQRDLLPAAKRAGVDVVAVSPQGPDGSRWIAESNALTFPVLTDRDGEFARCIGIAVEVTDGVLEREHVFGYDWTGVGGEWSAPTPTVLVLDAEGTVRFVADAHPRPAVIVAALEVLN